MKAKNIVLLIALFIAVPFAAQNYSNDDNKIFVVLDRNSKNIDFSEYIKMYDSCILEDYSYLFKTGIYDYTLNITFSHLEVPQLDRMDNKFRKPLTFLDSITYYDEKYIMETKAISRNLFHWKKLRDTRVFVIDMGTLKNDSVMMYEVTVGFDGYKM